MKKLYSLITMALVFIFTAPLAFATNPPEGNSLYFNGSYEYVRCSNIPLNARSFSISLWAKRLTYNSVDHIIGQGTNSANYGLHIGFRAENTFTFAFYANDLDTPSQPDDKAWHHWTCTFDNVTKERKIYRDGVELVSDIAPSASTYSGTGEFRIGNSTIGSDHFGGNVDEVAVWNKVLDSAQVVDIYSAAPDGTETDLLAYYNFNQEACETFVTDLVGSRNATFFNSPVWMKNDADLSAPRYVHVTDTMGTSFTLKWITPERGTPDFYSVVVASDANFTNIVEEATGITDFSHEVGNIPYGDTCFYKVIAANSLGEMPACSGDIIIKMDDPVLLSPTNITDTSFTINWNKITIADKYFVDVATDSSFTSYVVENFDAGDVGYCDIAGVTNPNIYYYRIRAYSTAADAYSNYTDTASILPFAKPSGNSLYFNGVSNYVNLGNDTSLQNLTSHNFTVEMFVKTKDFGRSILIGNYGNDPSFNLEIHTNNGGGVLRTYLDGASHYDDVNIADKKWHHIATVVDFDNDTVRMYIDGIETYSGEHTDDPYTVSRNMMLARDPRSGTHYYGGSMDEVRIWNYARSIDSIRQNMNTTYSGNETGLISYYNFNEDACSDTLTDLCSQNTGELVNQPLWLNSEFGITAPKNLSTECMSSSSANIQWQSGSGADYVSYYKVSVYDSEELLTPIIEDTTSTLSYLATGLLCDSTYYYQIAAVRDDIEMQTCGDDQFTIVADFWGNEVEQVSDSIFHANRYHFGSSVAIDGNFAVVGADAAEVVGRAYVYFYQDSSWIKIATLSPSDGESTSSHAFGYSVGIDGNTIVVGDRYGFGRVGYSGLVYVFEKPANGWVNMTETAKLTASDGEWGDYFGTSVSISGNNIVVGANGDDDMGSNSGSAYVYKKPSSGWTTSTETAKLTASDGADSDYFGLSVSMSDSTIVAGAYYDDDGISNSGSVYVFKEPASGWITMTETAKLNASDPAANDYFGRSVSIADSTIAVGAYGDDDNGYFSGSVYLFKEPANGWVSMTETAILTASDPSSSSNYFGYSVDISESTIVVGAYNYNNYGMAYVFEEPTGGWVTATQNACLSAYTSHTGSYFGRSVAVSADHIVVGAYVDDSVGMDAGAAYFYTKPTGSWIDTTEDLCELPTLTFDHNYLTFGSAVAIHGNYAVVGALGYDYYRGKADVYHKHEGKWQKIAELKSSTNNYNAYFGSSVAITDSIIAIGAERENSSRGAVYVFKMPETGWMDTTETAILTASNGKTWDYFGTSINICNNTIVIGATGGHYSGYIGQTYLFEKPANGWVTTTETAILSASDEASQDYFGKSVSISGNTVVVGAYNDDDGGSSTGSAYVYKKPSSGWVNMTETAKLMASDGQSNDYFGYSIDISDSTLVVGAYYEDEAASDAGAVYSFTKGTAGWTNAIETKKFVPLNGQENQQFGQVLGVDGNNIIVGSPGYDENGQNSGKVYFYDWQVHQAEIKAQPRSFTDLCGENTIQYGIESFNNNTSQWQVSTDNGATYTNVSDNNYYSGAKTDTLTVITNETLNNNLYRCYITNDQWRKNSDEVILKYETEEPEFTILPVDETIIACEFAVPDYLSQVSATDVCSKELEFAQFPEAGTFITGPINEILFSVRDKAGNVSDTSINIAVIESEAPVLAVEDYTIELDSTGNAQLYLENVVTSATDNCSVADTTLSQTDFDCAQLDNITAVTATLYDAIGNTHEQVTNITVVDNIAPIFDVQDITVYLDSTGNAELNPADVVTSAFDNCTISDTVLSQTAFNGDHLFSKVTVDVQLSDISENVKSKNIQVTAVDTIKPELSVTDLTLEFDANGLAYLQAADVVTSAWDNVAADTSLSHTEFNSSHIDSLVEVTVTLTDESGNSVTQIANIIIEDNMAPVAYADELANVLAECSTESPMAPMAIDNISDTIIGTTTTVFPITVQCDSIITWTFVDDHGNASTQEQRIIIDDVTAATPDVASLTDVVTECSAEEPTAPTATDNCAGTITGTTTTVFPITVQCDSIITWTFDDGEGNVSTQPQRILVEDKTAPVTDESILGDINAECEVTELAPPVATDNCTDVIVSRNGSLPITKQGETTVTWIFTDMNGNSSFKTQNIVIADDTNPEISCVENMVVNTKDENYVVNGTELDSVQVSDNCTLASVSNSFNRSESLANAELPIGLTTVVWTATDEAGNTKECSMNITVNRNVGVSSLSLEGVKVYPNPTQGLLNIEIDDNKVEQIKIMSLNGDVIEIISDVQVHQKVDISWYQSGVYLIYIQTDEGTVVTRIMKQ